MENIENLVKLLSRLPGIGPRSARRTVLHMLKKRETLLYPLADGLKIAGDTVCDCAVCGNLDTTSPCHVCQDTSRDKTTLCVVEDVADMWAMLRTGAYTGQFHILGGVLSPMDGITPNELHISGLLKRMETDTIHEVILATNLTVEGQSTAHYITEILEPYTVTITRLAHGVPMGGELDYMDDGTISIALKSRTHV